MNFLLGIALALSPRSHGDSQRLITWDIAAKTALEHPWIGVGPDNFGPYFMVRRPASFGNERAADAHNDILQVAATVGFVGLAAYCWFVVAGFSVLRGPALAAVVALFVNAKFSPVELEPLILAAVIAGAYEK